MGVRIEVELEFLDPRGEIVLLGLAVALGHFVTEFAVIEDLANGRACVWGDFDQVEAG
jgi:hypothetical protein